MYLFVVVCVLYVLISLTRIAIGEYAGQHCVIVRMHLGQLFPKLGVLLKFSSYKALHLTCYTPFWFAERTLYLYATFVKVYTTYDVSATI